jgi:hypothetical protein
MHEFPAVKRLGQDGVHGLKVQLFVEQVHADEDRDDDAEDVDAEKADVADGADLFVQGEIADSKGRQCLASPKHHPSWLTWPAKISMILGMPLLRTRLCDRSAHTALADGSRSALPEWMTNAGRCAATTLGLPVVDVAALVELRQLLDTNGGQGAVERASMDSKDVQDAEADTVDAASAKPVLDPYPHFRIPDGS